jgi:heavy metal translocating P-type ATPase
MLLEATDSIDPQKFKETGLFRKCLEMGIIPESEADLEKRTEMGLAGPRPAPDFDDAEITKDQQMSAGEVNLGLTLSIDGMWCPACAWVIDEALKKKPGVIDPICNFSTDRFRCEYDPILTSPAQIIDTIGRLGYRAYLPGDSAQSGENRKEFIRFGISSFLTMNVMMLSFALYSGFFTDLSHDAVIRISWPIFIMSTCVLFYGGFKILQKALSGITNAAYSMETLISLGALSSYLYSCYNFFTGSIHQYFDTTVVLITLVLLGKLLERKAKNKVQEDLERFFFLMPKKVRLCTPSFPEGRYVHIDQLERNDFFLVEEGEIIPADGLIATGKGTVDESSLTGEALPVTKRQGDRLKSGTKVMKGMFRVHAEAVRGDAILGQMIRIMEKTLDQKTPVEGSTDLILRWFVPLIVTLAFVTCIISMLLGLSAEDSMIRSITVLVIACPCALGIAIPMARVAGVSLAGRKGILVRNFSAFTRAGKVNTFVFDKTGTVTQGNWSLQDILSFGTFTKDDILSMAASLERDSEHYIAMEIKGQAKKRRLDLLEIRDIKCYENGVAGWVGKDRIKIGAKEFLNTEIKASIPEAHHYGSQFDPACSMVFMSFAGRLCGVLFFGDKVRQSAISAIKKLRSSGHHIVLVSGDGETTTRIVGERIGVHEFHGGKMPQDKALFIENMQKQGLVVCMAGDGVNDAPALARADLSFAIYSGSNLGKEAADITLMRGDPAQISNFLRLAARTKSKISQNLVFSFVYNIICVPVAMTGLLTPLIAVCAMLMSSLTVIGNTLLLVRHRT